VPTYILFNHLNSIFSHLNCYNHLTSFYISIFPYNNITHQIYPVFLFFLSLSFLLACGVRKYLFCKSYIWILSKNWPIQGNRSEVGRWNLKDKPSTGVSRYLADTSLVNNSSGSLEVLAKQEMQTGFMLHKDQKQLQ